MNIVLAAGGTGGHIIPAIAVAEALRDRAPDVRVCLLGTGAEIEQRLCSRYGLMLHSLPAAPFVGKGIAGRMRSAAGLPRAVYKAAQFFRGFKPEAVLGFGGYPSVAPVLAAWITGRPALIHEQNAEVGLANRMLSLICRKVYAVHGAQGFWRSGHASYLSNPVRREFAALPPWQAPAAGEPLRVLVVGGSQGAVTLNTAILAQIPIFKRFNVTLVHQSGKLDYERLCSSYAAASWRAVEVRPFIDCIAEAYARAHLVICRAGALTVAEVTAAGRPAIYVPLRIARGHQALNAAHAVSRGAAVLLEQTPQLASRLGEVLEELLGAPEKLQPMADAARVIAEEGGLCAADTLAAEVVNAASGYSAKEREGRAEI